jgi:hypothetical protein
MDSAIVGDLLWYYKGNHVATFLGLNPNPGRKYLILEGHLNNGSPGIVGISKTNNNAPDGGPLYTEALWWRDEVFGR